ncbi:MAG: isopenicillin N synthase family dioxygenase [Pontibacterium sp.]
MSLPLPIIDISPLTSGDLQAQNDVAFAIDKACREVGFFYVTGHGIEPEIMEALMQHAHDFFDLPFETKQQIDITRSNNHRGYGAIATENLDPSIPPDLKESFDMALDLSPDHPRVNTEMPLYGPNQYPDLPGWQAFMEAHYQRMLGLALTLLSGIARALNIAPDFFDDKFDCPISVLRLLKYPAQPATADSQQLGAGAHTDYGCITLLWQDEIGGLEVMDVTGQWVSAPPVENAFVVNIGNMMARWSNDRYRSTPHRVKNHPSKTRFSVPFFVEPNFETVIECLPNCRPDNEEPKYPTTTAGEWLLYCFANTYAYRKEK